MAGATRCNGLRLRANASTSHLVGVGCGDWSVRAVFDVGVDASFLAKVGGVGWTVRNVTAGD
jgi:hypothetical protein